MLKSNFLANIKIDRFYVTLIAIVLAILGQYLLNQRFLTLSIISFLSAIFLAFFSFRHTNNIEFHLPIRKMEWNGEVHEPFLFFQLDLQLFRLFYFQDQFSRFIPGFFIFSVLFFLFLAALNLPEANFTPRHFSRFGKILNYSFSSLSLIVAVPIAVVLLVLPEVTVAFNVKLSDGSSMVSSVVGTLTVMLVCTAGIVTVVVVAV